MQTFAPKQTPLQKPKAGRVRWSQARGSAPLENDGELEGSQRRRNGSAFDFAQIGIFAANFGRIQRKLTINKPGDEHEKQAELVAEQVMRATEGPQIQRAPSGGSGGLSEAPPMVTEVLGSAGRALDRSTSNFMGSRLGYDFSQVRIHTDARAAISAGAIGARAYTAGSHVVFGEGQFEPSSRAGRRLLAHELTHVVQQKAAAESGTLVQRDDTSREAPNAKSWTGAPAHCPSDFCTPLGSNLAANNRRASYWPPFKGIIGLVVDARVRPLWNDWAYGGSSSVRDLSKDFGADFTASPTTDRITKYLLGEITSALTASPPALSGGSAKLDIPTLIPTAVKAIDTPGDPHEMNFSLPRDIPGNIAGGIGKDQAANPIGANPSPQDDARIAKGDVTVADLGSKLMVVPNLRFTVKDTIDLCPGDCGSPREQKATVEMSRWEATGISGDVPFTVDFSPAITQLVPYNIPKPSASPKKP
jgi:hypothetical protein